MMIHAFGAYFGLGVSWILYDGSLAISTYKDKKSSNYHSDVFSMIGKNCPRKYCFIACYNATVHQSYLLCTLSLDVSFLTC